MAYSLRAFPGPAPTRTGAAEAGKGAQPSFRPAQVASPDVHLMRAEAQVGVQDQAGGQVVVLAQLAGGHSVWPHGAPHTMLPRAESGEGLRWLRAAAELRGPLGRPSGPSSTRRGGLGGEERSVPLQGNKCSCQWGRPQTGDGPFHQQLLRMLWSADTKALPRTHTHTRARTHAHTDTRKADHDGLQVCGDPEGLALQEVRVKRLTPPLALTEGGGSPLHPQSPSPLPSSPGSRREARVKPQAAWRGWEGGGGGIPAPAPSPRIPFWGKRGGGLRGQSGGGRGGKEPHREAEWVHRKGLGEGGWQHETKHDP